MPSRLKTSRKINKLGIGRECSYAASRRESQDGGRKPQINQEHEQIRQVGRGKSPDKRKEGVREKKRHLSPQKAGGKKGRSLLVENNFPNQSVRR